jgi:putative thiamine transport system ATP-binding protein
MTANSLRFESVAIRLRERVLVSLDAEVLPGQVLTVMGPSGSGKSTLLAYVAGFLAPAFSASGAVRLDGQDITRMPAHARRVGLLFQDPLLFPHMSVGENLLFAIAPGDRSARHAIAADALAEAGLEGFFERDPATLSGGQKARAALMRVLVSRPRALLLDEPFSRLDADLRTQIRNFVFGEARQRNLPVLLVTHDEADAAAAGGKIVRLG